MAFGGMGGFGGLGAGMLSNGVTHSGSPGNGLPFAGIPDELADGVARTLAREPAHPEPAVTFTHQPLASRRVSIGYLLSQHPRALAIAVALIVLETLSIQAGPLLTQIGIDEGIVARDVSVVALTAALYLSCVLATA